MATVQTDLHSLPHAVFLHRVADVRADQGESKLGQGAFLALRLIDLLMPGDDASHPDAFEYQWAATDRFCRSLGPTSTEGSHLKELVTSAAAAYRRRDITLLTPALFAYAHYLEDSLDLEEALDVLSSLRRITAKRLSSADAVALSLREGRVNRKLNRFDEADRAYAEASDRARHAGDCYSELLSRIGRANTIAGRGNLPEAERRLTEVLVDARNAGIADAEARAEHGLAVVLQHRGSPDIALTHMWRAFELYEDGDSRVRALNDVGIMLLTLGDAAGAERALSEAVRRGGMQDNVTNATIELMHCASFRRDRMTFERCRVACERLKANMPPNILADYHLKVGIGEARFAQYRRAAASMTRGLEIAEGAGLHEFVFKIERIRGGLDACEQMQAAEQSETTPIFESDALREVSASVAQLVAEPV